MGRMHAPGKGISQSALPYRRSVPTWLKLTSDEVKDQIYKLAKKGLTPSQIGVILRDSQGPDLQVGQEGSDSFSDRCHPQRQSWSCPGQIHHRQQDSPHLERQGNGSYSARGLLLSDQEGSLHQKAS